MLSDFCTPAYFGQGDAGSKSCNFMGPDKDGIVLVPFSRLVDGYYQTFDGHSWTMHADSLTPYRAEMARLGLSARRR